MGEAYELFPHNHLSQVPFSLSVQSSILPLFISPEEEILLPGQLLWILICYRKTLKKIRLKEKHQECFCNAFFLSLSCEASWVRENNMRHVESANTMRQIYEYTVPFMWRSALFDLLSVCTYSTIPWLINHNFLHKASPCIPVSYNTSHCQCHQYVYFLHSDTTLQ